MSNTSPLNILTRYFFVLLIFANCNQPGTRFSTNTTLPAGERKQEPKPVLPSTDYGYELIAKKAGFVEISYLHDSIYIEMRYATKNNFTKTNLYGDFNKAYVEPAVANKMRQARTFLQTQNKGYTLIVYDAARPVKVQQQLWDLAPISEDKKYLYLSHPSQHSLHNYGAAVDVAILDTSMRLLDFGSPYDFFGEEAQPRAEQKLLKARKLSATQIANRNLLRSVMTKAGFRPIKTEWWHFNACTRAYAKQHLKLFQ